MHCKRGLPVGNLLLIQLGQQTKFWKVNVTGTSLTRLKKTIHSSSIPLSSLHPTKMQGFPN